MRWLRRKNNEITPTDFEAECVLWSRLCRMEAENAARCSYFSLCHGKNWLQVCPVMAVFISAGIFRGKSLLGSKLS
jgi:hypothetical protein